MNNKLKIIIERIFIITITLSGLSCSHNNSDTSVIIVIENNSNYISPIDIEVKIDDSLYVKGNFYTDTIFPTNKFYKINLNKGEHKIYVSSAKEKLMTEKEFQVDSKKIIYIIFNYYEKNKKRIEFDKKLFYQKNDSTKVFVPDSVIVAKSFNIKIEEDKNEPMR
jgi:hypothetical protein